MKRNFSMIFILKSLSILFFVAFLESCATQQPKSAWMDVKHARELDHKNGNRAKHLQKNVARANHY